MSDQQMSRYYNDELQRSVTIDLYDEFDYDAVGYYVDYENQRVIAKRYYDLCYQFAAEGQSPAGVTTKYFTVDEGPRGEANKYSVCQWNRGKQEYIHTFDTEQQAENALMNILLFDLDTRDQTPLIYVYESDATADLNEYKSENCD